MKEGTFTYISPVDTWKDSSYNMGRIEANVEERKNPAFMYLDNLTAEATGMSQEDNDMPKKIRQRAVINGEEYWLSGDKQQDIFDAFLKKAQDKGLIEKPEDRKKNIPTVKQFIEQEYEPAFIRQLAPTTADTYAQYIKLNIVPFMGDMRMDEVTVATVQRFYDWMATAGERGRKKNLNADTIKRVGGLLSRIFKVAVEMKIINDSPMKQTLLRIRAEEAGHHTALTDSEINRIKAEIPKMENEERRVYMALLAYTGMRPEEVYGLRWEDICLEHGYAQIVRAVTYPGNNKPSIGKPKTKRSGRTVLLAQKVVSILSDVQKDSGFVLGGEKPWCYSKKSRVSKAAFKDLGISGYTDADFRTTFGTQMKEAGKSSAQVADLMGHADTRMVERVYARTRHEGVMKLREDVERIS